MDIMLPICLFHSLLIAAPFCVGFVDGQNRSGFFRCRWYTYTEGKTAQNARGGQNKFLVGTETSGCHDRLTKASFQKYCIDDRRARAACGEDIPWTCKDVFDVCREAIARPGLLDEGGNNRNVTKKDTSSRISNLAIDHETSARVGQFTSAILAFLLGVALATIAFMIISWRHMLFCNRHKGDIRPKSVGSGVYEGGSENQNSGGPNSVSVIQNPNYFRENAAVPTSDSSETERQVSTRSKTSSSYEQLQYGEAGTLVVRPIDGRNDSSKSASYKYMDMTMPGASTVPDPNLPTPALDGSVQYSAVSKDK